MPFPKGDLQAEYSNYSSKEAKSQKKTISTQKLFNLNDRASLSHKTMIQKFRQQAQELKDIKKTISSLTHSRLSKMTRLKAQIFAEPQSLNLYKLTQTETRESLFSRNKNRKAIINLGYDHHRDQETRNQPEVEPTLDFTKQQRFTDFVEVNLVQKQELKTDENIQQYIDKNIKVKESAKIQPKQHKNSFSISNSNIKSRCYSATQLKNISIYKKQKTHQNNKTQASLGTSRYESSNNLKKRYEERLKESRARIMESKVKLVESQTNFKLEKKIKQNVHLIEKQRTLHELIQNRMQRQRQKAEQQKRKSEQKRFVHDSRKLKVNIQRIYKRQCAHQQKQLQRSRSEETLLDLTYKRFAKEVESVKKQQLLAYRLEFLKNLKPVDYLACHTNPEKDSMETLYQKNN